MYIELLWGGAISRARSLTCYLITNMLETSWSEMIADLCYSQLRSIQCPSTDCSVYRARTLY